MKIHSTQAIRFDAEEKITVIVPCTPSTDVARVLLDLTNSELDSADRVASDFDAAKEEVGTVFHRGVRFDLVGVKHGTFSGFKQALHMYAVKYKAGKYAPVLYMQHLSQTADYNRMLEASVNGLGLASYNVGLYKSDNNNELLKEFSVFGSEVSKHASRGMACALTQREILELVNTPSNHKSPQTLADWAVNSGEKYGYLVEVLDGSQLEEQGFHALLAVNRGSEYPARFIICDYTPEGYSDDQPLVALVGKGVTFDTGGISIKPSNNMHYMKSDMGGAAAVLGAVELSARLKADVRVIGFVPTTDNSVDARAIKPGDVIDSYSGQTIEVINTDAEGRLILADALCYAIRNYKPDYLVDLATLTGSVVRALGTQCAGLFTHDDDLANRLSTAGEAVGERLWRLPLWEDYADEMRSEIADIKNLSDKPLAGAITAAKFLEHFVEEHPKWAHLDIAGTAFKNNGVTKNHSATAFGVRLLYEFIDSISST